MESTILIYRLRSWQQHDLETSRNKTPWRVKRADGSVPITPQSTSTQKTQSVANSQADKGLQTPSRPRTATELTISPKRPYTKKIVHIPQSPPKKTPKLRGFINAFEPSTPRSSVRFAAQPDASQSTPATRKGKERAEPEHELSASQNEDIFFNPPSPKGARESSRNNSPFLQQLQAGRSVDMPDPDSQSPPSSAGAMPTSSNGVPAEAQMEVDPPPERIEELVEPFL